jgi:hypothetical protein
VKVSGILLTSPIEASSQLLIPAAKNLFQDEGSSFCLAVVSACDTRVHHVDSHSHIAHADDFTLNTYRFHGTSAPFHSVLKEASSYAILALLELLPAPFGKGNDLLLVEAGSFLFSFPCPHYHSNLPVW